MSKKKYGLSITAILKEEIEKMSSQKVIEIKESAYEEFKKKLTLEKVKELSLLLREGEVLGRVDHDQFISVMKVAFGDTIRLISLYEKIFNRFKMAKFNLINQKDKYYLSKIVQIEKINVYELCCALISFVKCQFEDKLRCLFEMTDIDEDGYLNEKEIIRLMTTLNIVFAQEETPINSESVILNQSLLNMKNQDSIKMLMYYPGDLKETLRKETYINFETFYSAFVKIPYYKYQVVPFYLNFESCLNNVTEEKKLKVDKNIKNEFLKVSSEILSSVRLIGPKTSDYKIKLLPKVQNKHRNLANSNFHNPNNKHKYETINTESQAHMQGSSLTKHLKNLSSVSTNINNNSKHNNSNNNTITHNNINTNSNINTNNNANNKNSKELSLDKKNNLKNKFKLPFNFNFNNSKTRNDNLGNQLTGQKSSTSNLETVDLTSKNENTEQRESSLYRFKSSIKALIVGKTRYAVNVHKIRNMEVQPCLLEFYDRKQTLSSEDDKKNNVVCETTYNKFIPRYISQEEILNEINNVANKHRGDDVTEGEMFKILDDLKVDADDLKGKLKEKDKYGNRIFFGKQKDLKMILK